MAKIVFSIIVPFKTIANLFIQETMPAILNQSFQNFEIILLPDKEDAKTFPKTRIIPTWPKLGPSDKKDIGIKEAKGDYCVFIDDDVYPDKDWLKNALRHLEDPTIAAVCGPGVTPPSDSMLSKVSGWMWASLLGSGGAGTYRCWPQKERFVDDYPSFNLIVKKTDLEKIGGYDSLFWPGEDTKLCHDLVYKLNKKILYDPSVLVYHHRRDILGPHLKQIGRYGKHRGFFVKILPRTSRRVGYLIPPAFSLGVVFTPIALLVASALSIPYLYIFWTIYASVIGIYTFALLLTAIWVLIKSKSVIQSLLTIPTIFISHVYYGFMFLQGISQKVVVSKYSRDKI